MADERTRLSKRGAVAFGLLFIAAGAFPMLTALGVLPHSTADPDTPAWLGILIALAFMLGGVSIIVAYAIGGADSATGELAPNTPFAIQLAQYVLGLAIVASMGLVFGWVAFGPGEGHFSTSIGSGSVGAATYDASGSHATFGRIMFGLCTVMFAAAFFAFAISGARRLAKARTSNQV